MMLGTSNIRDTATGKRFNQQRSISPSYLKRGKVARNNTNKKQNKQVFKPKITACKFIKDSFTNISGRL